MPPCVWLTNFTHSPVSAHAVGFHPFSILFLRYYYSPILLFLCPASFTLPPFTVYQSLCVAQIAVEAIAFPALTSLSHEFPLIN